jgi:hypothetical protein
MQEGILRGKGPFDAFLDEEFVITPLDAQKFWKASSSNNAGDRNLFAQQSSLPYNPNSMESMAAWLVEKVQHTLVWLSIPRVCAFCKEEYRPIHNLGKWMCRWHPGERLEKYYSCCKKNSRGCQPCDHSPISKVGQRRWTDDNRGVRVPQLLFRILQFREDSVVEDVQNDEDIARSHFWLDRAPKEKL